MSFFSALVFVPCLSQIKPIINDNRFEYVSDRTLMWVLDKFEYCKIPLQAILDFLRNVILVMNIQHIFHSVKIETVYEISSTNFVLTKKWFKRSHQIQEKRLLIHWSMIHWLNKAFKSLILSHEFCSIKRIKYASWLRHQ